MAIAMRTFGNTLSDLQAGTNADKALEYSRYNAQDQITQAKMEAFMRLRAQQLQNQYQQNELAQNRALRMQELAQQDKQFGTSEANRMTLADKVAASQLAVANATKGGVDPRAFETILAYNQQGADRESIGRAYSAKRKSYLAEIKAYKDKHFYGNGPGAAEFKSAFGREPDAQAAAAGLNALDTQALQLGFEPDDIGGGYVIKPFTPIVPGGLRGTGGVPAPATTPNPIQPAQPAQIEPQAPVPAMLNPVQPSAFDVVPGSAFDHILNGPVAPMPDALSPSTITPGTTARFRWTPNGAVAY